MVWTDGEGMSVGPSKSLDDVSGHPTECRGDTRTHARAGGSGISDTPPPPQAEVFLFSAELNKRAGLNKGACGDDCGPDKLAPGYPSC